MGIDVLIVSLGTTGGLRAGDRELAASMERAGASVEVMRAAATREAQTHATRDLLQAWACRRAAAEGLATHQPRAVVYSSTTASFFWPRPGIIRFDSPAAGNRPGRGGAWQRALERKRFRQASLVVPTSVGGLREGPAPRGGAVVVPFTVEPSGSLASPRDITAITYAPTPAKKGLDRVLEAWNAARRPGETLVVTACPFEINEEGVRSTLNLQPGEYRALVRRARIFIAAPRREDFGLAQLEALADGCMLVTSEGSGPYVAVAHARKLDPRLVGDDLAGGIRAALDTPLPGYAERAIAELAPYRREAVDRVVGEQLLPTVLGGADRTIRPTSKPKRCPPRRDDH